MGLRTIRDNISIVRDCASYAWSNNNQQECHNGYGYLSLCLQCVETITHGSKVLFLIIAYSYSVHSASIRGYTNKGCAGTEAVTNTSPEFPVSQVWQLPNQPHPQK